MVHNLVTTSAVERLAGRQVLSNKSPQDITNFRGGAMWIAGDVNLPTEVVGAHAEGRLVFFVGAGASMDPPSSLPSFSGLARELASLARVPFDGKAAMDTFLGSLPTSFDTHAQALRLIDRGDSTHNPTHSAIVRVASAIAPARIVTTNFDDHLASAAVDSSAQIEDKWIGPALPLGDAFTGIVHLHGSVLRAPHDLVLTDRDFGRAYLTDAWTTRFLQRMFAAFTVLFIGYSHDVAIHLGASGLVPTHAGPQHRYSD